jgi:hypothetical protein
MSTKHQRYSTENQAEAIAQYAARRGFEIVQTYEDSGRPDPERAAVAAAADCRRATRRRRVQRDPGS